MESKDFYSPLPKIMVLTMILGFVSCLLFGTIYALHQIDWLFTAAVTCGVIAYHMLIRFMSPVILQCFFHKQYDYRAWWFQQRKWEPSIYCFLKVKKWKRNIISYDPSEFSLRVHSLEEVVNNMCHAEAAHELIVLLSFTTLLFSIPFRAFPAFLITAIMAACMDMIFVIIQRYNRPRLMRLIKIPDSSNEKRGVGHENSD